MASPIEATPTLYGEDAQRLIDSLGERCTHEEAQRRVAMATRVLTEMTAKRTPRSIDGVPPLLAEDTPTMRLPKRWWTVVVHYVACDPEHRCYQDTFEVYDEDGKRVHCGLSFEDLLRGVAIGGQEIAARRVDVSDLTGYDFRDGSRDVAPVMREDWYSIDPDE